MAGQVCAAATAMTTTSAHTSGATEPGRIGVPAVEALAMTRSPRLLAVVQAAALAAGLVSVATAGPTQAAPPAGAISSNVEFVANLPEANTAISLNFIGDTMFVSAESGISSYDVSNPRAPKLLGALPHYIWENEDVDVDPARHLLFVSRDPRGFTSPATTAFPYGAVEVYDVSNPAVFKPVSATLLPTGHTTTCVGGCRWTWTGGPATSPVDAHDWGFGRPIFALDMKDPSHPVQCAHPIDTNRSDGKTSYAHDVQVDSTGVAWVSGDGGVRGYWVTGRHRDPVDGKTKTATGCDPIPYAGGGTELGRDASRGGLMHNAWRDMKAKVDGVKGAVLYVTEEVTGASSCAGYGKFAIYDLRGSFHGEGWRNIAATHFRLKPLSTWTPERQPGSNGCDSAHYFTDRGDQVLAGAYYSQGTRFLDVSNPRHPRQIAYYRPNDASTWAAYWHKGYVFIADNARGIDIIRLTGPAAKLGAATSAAPVTAPLLPAGRSLADIGMTRDPVWHWMCGTP
ncbi:MAG: hypothetical protein QOG34_1269 [Frankiaceae bacterium]|jgi:hypothetical protein|nr:hypothetical protein [Frankiaceae bacterium]